MYLIRNTGTKTKNKLLSPYKESKEYLCIGYDIGWYLEILMYTSSPLAISCILSSVQTISMSHLLCSREWLWKLNTGKQKNSILRQHSSLILQEYYCIVLYCIFGCTMRHAGSWFPNQELNLCLLQWEHGLSATGPPRKSSNMFCKFTFN